MAVEMHWVGDGDVVVDDDSDAGVLAKIVNIPLWVVGIGSIAQAG